MNKVVALLLAACCSMPALADYEDGVNAALAGDFDRAYAEFKIAADEGLNMAQYNLGILYFTGQGVKQDLGEAFRWTLAAAEQGHTAAQANLASLYFEGQGTRKDEDKAVEWYMEAARAGHGASAYTLATMYQKGSAVKRDRIQAHAWASMAQGAQYAEADALLSALERRMDDAEIGEARRLFARWQIQ